MQGQIRSKIANLDHKISLKIFKITSKNDSLHAIAVIFARWVFWALLIAIAIVIVLRKDPIHVSMLLKHMGLTLLLGMATNLILGKIFVRKRPFTRQGVHALIPTRWLKGSFPSDHAMISFAIAIPLLVADPTTGIYALIMAMAIAISRVAVGVHYATDIVTGAVVATIASTIASVLIK